MERELKYVTPSGDELAAKIEINRYLSNGCIYIGLLTEEEGDWEPYGDITVNLREGAPDYCGYLDTNNMSGLEEFIKQNDIGEFTGLVQRSGFCTYPLYLFDPENLRELCPKGMAEYEASIQPVKKDVQEKGRSR